MYFSEVLLYLVSLNTDFPPSFPDSQSVPVVNMNNSNKKIPPRTQGVVTDTEEYVCFLGNSTTDVRNV